MNLVNMTVIIPALRIFSEKIRISIRVLKILNLNVINVYKDLIEYDEPLKRFSND